MVWARQTNALLYKRMSAMMDSNVQGPRTCFRRSEG